MEELSFADAQDRVREAIEASWEADGVGEFYIAPYGSETPTHWRVIFGAREWIVDNDVMFMLVGTPITLVSKTIGEISELSYIANFDLVDAMTDVGEIHFMPTLVERCGRIAPDVGISSIRAECPSLLASAPLMDGGMPMST